MGGSLASGKIALSTLVWGQLVLAVVVARFEALMWAVLGGMGGSLLPLERERAVVVKGGCTGGGRAHWVLAAEPRTCWIIFSTYCLSCAFLFIGREAFTVLTKVLHKTSSSAMRSWALSTSGSVFGMGYLTV